MFKTIKSLAIATSVMASLSIPSAAFGQAIANIEVTGIEGTDYILQGGTTLEEVLQGSCDSPIICNPGGYVALKGNEDLTYQISYHHARALEAHSRDEFMIVLDQIVQLYSELFDSSEVTSLSGMVGDRDIALSTLTFREIYGEEPVSESLDILDQAEFPRDFSTRTGESTSVPLAAFEPFQAHFELQIGEYQWWRQALSYYDIEEIAQLGGVDVEALTSDIVRSASFFPLSFPEPLDETGIAYINQEDDLIKISLRTDEQYNYGPLISRLLQAYFVEGRFIDIDPGLVPTDVENLYAFRPGVAVTYNGMTEVFAPEWGVFTDPYREIVLPAASTERVPEPSTVLGTLLVIGLGVLLKQQHKTPTNSSLSETETQH